jgi:hypothetical protein
MKTGKSAEKTGIKRYNLAIPEGLYKQVETIAKTNKMSVVDILKRFIKLGLLVEASPNAQFLIREDDTEREIILL